MRIPVDLSRMRRQKGFVLIATGISIFALLGATGLAVDLGRMYIAKNEIQAFSDAAALLAAQQLDGTNNGISAAKTSGAAAKVYWSLATQTVSNPTFEFSQTPASSGSYAWVSNPGSATGYTTVRVTSSVGVPMYFMRVLTGSATGSVSAQAVAGQVSKTVWKQGVFPFSPFAQLFALSASGHAAYCSNPISTGCMDSTTGLIVGQEYTLRWPSNPSLGNGSGGNNSNMCLGDKAGGQTMIDMANQAGGSERGYIEDTASSVMRQTIVDDYQSVSRTVGDLVTMTGGAKQTELDALNARIAQDTNTTDNTRDAYYRNPHNNRRIVAALINNGVLVNGNQFTAIQMGGFLLKTTGLYGNGGNQSWCAIYLGPYCQGCKGMPGGSSGGFVIRLLQ